MFISKVLFYDTILYKTQKKIYYVENHLLRNQISRIPVEKRNHLPRSFRFLGIDKNTIGKAVRGGNLNMSVLLTICNMYHLNIADFFVLEHDGEENQTHENSINPILSDNKQVLSSVSEEFEKYKISKKPKFQYEDFLASKDQEIALLREINELYKKQIELLQEKVLEIDNKNDL